MLDVGCAAGFLLEVARERGWDARGVELNRDFAARTATSLEGRITYGRFHDVPFAARSFALITMFDVLEHSPTPREDLAKCRDLLADGGALVVQLPCIDALGRKLLGARWYHYAPPAHLSYFTAHSFGLLAASLGLHVKRASWTRKLLTVDYFVAQVAMTAGAAHAPKLPAIGAARIRVPMSERLFVVSRS
jgi:SAM-dependent methyltransferase